MIESECLLYEDNDIALFWAPYQYSKFSIVTFTPRLGRKQPGPSKIDSGFGYNFFKNKEITGFYIVPKWNHWWQVPGMEAIVRLINEKRYPNQTLWTYGVSMGGNGALMFADSLKAQGVISFNPQASVSPSIADFDSRWIDDRNEIAHFDDSWLHSGITEQTWIFGDSACSLDKRHVDVIKNCYPNVNYISVPFTGHSTIRALMESGLLSSTIFSVMNGIFSSEAFKKKLRAARHASPVIWTEASNRLSTRGADKAAFKCSSMAISLLEASKANGTAIDSANATLTLMAHANNVLKIRNKDAAKALLESLQNRPMVDFDFSWQKFQLADLLDRRQEVAEIIQSKLCSRDFDERWFSALVRITKAGIVSPMTVKDLEQRIGKAILSQDQAKRYTFANSTISPHRQSTIDGSGNVKYIFGASQALRWSIHVSNGVVGSGLLPECIIGWGGAPIWSKKLFETAKEKAIMPGRLGVIVGDFLFGNRICMSSVDQNTDLMQDGFLGIDATVLNSENDTKMLERGLKGVLAWHQYFGQRVRFIFWSLFGRQILDRLAGRYLSKNRYKHPTFNYSDITSRLPGVDIVDLAPLLLLPVHEVSRLFIDGSSNPSYIGYLLLDALLVEGVPPIDAYQQCVVAFESELLALAKQTKRFHNSTILLTGRSIWLDTFARYLGADGAVKLADKGIILAPVDKYAGLQYSIDELPDGISLGTCAVFIISSRGTDLSAVLATKTNTTVDAWQNIPVIDWEGSTELVITARGETPKFTQTGSGRVRDVVEIEELKPEMVELGPLGIPTWPGLQHILTAISKIENNTLVDDPSYRIEGAVLVSNGIAFLVEGNHSVLKYATGALKPTEQSLKNFSDNIYSRSQMASQIFAPYAHVIFPDKQSVLDKEFPFKPVHRLGDEYLNATCSTTRKHVIYPRQALTDAGGAFWPLDTHLTDYGSLVVLRSMLEVVGVHADKTLAHIEKQINKPVNWSGDLGNKLKPPLKQNGILLNPDWEVTVLRNNIGFNDGLIDVLLNPHAMYDYTVLLFGDSFFRMMLQHLSAVFARVICLRTRFMHPEILALIRPDFVFTGNAERYLSHVVSDTEAHAFYLYPYMRQGSDLTMGDNFLEVWTAITSPKSAKYRDFLKKYSMSAG